jgi:plasmid stability protein
MKNVTIALDDETHRKARIRAAELGTSLSALVKDYLNALAGGDKPVAASGVREMTMTFTPAESEQGGPPWLVDGKWSYTRDGKPRQPGALRSKFKPVELEDLETPGWLIDIMEGSDDDFSDPLPFDASQLPK